MLFKLTIVADAQAQTVLQRKWAQWRSGCGKIGWGEPPITNSHFNYHSSSITETSRATSSLDQPAAAPSAQKENSHFLSKVQPNANRQQKSKTCSNGEVDMLNTLETTVI